MSTGKRLSEIVFNCIFIYIKQIYFNLIGCPADQIRQISRGTEIAHLLPGLGKCVLWGHFGLN